jgi:hypothetical protein
MREPYAAAAPNTMSGPAGPVFVAGCPRSGTTALSWAIAALPGYHTSAEMHFFYYLLREADDHSLSRVFSHSSGAGSWFRKWEVPFEAFLSYLGVGFDRMIRDSVGDMQWIDGSPENVIVGEALLTMFPRAHMFVAVRDPRSVCLSMLNSGFAQPWARDLDAAIFEWTYYARATLQLAAARPDRVLIVKQEDMRARSEAVAADIAARLNLDTPGPIGDYLRTRTINSSFDKRTYAPNSPFRSAEAAFPADRFMAEHGERVMRDTAELAARFGYFAEHGADSAAAARL